MPSSPATRCSDHLADRRSWPPTVAGQLRSLSLLANFLFFGFFFLNFVVNEITGDALVQF